GVSQHRNDLGEPEYRVGESVCQHDRQGIGPLPLLMDEMDDLATFHLCAEVREGIESVLLRSPVESALPVERELAHVRDAETVPPPRIVEVVDPTRGEQTVLQVVENRLRYVDGEWNGGHGPPRGEAGTSRRGCASDGRTVAAPTSRDLEARWRA